MEHRPILLCGDPHGRVDHIIRAAGEARAAAVLLLGDIEPDRPLQDAMRPLTENGVSWYFIGGNHDADSDDVALRVWNAETESHNVHGKVATLPNGLRVAGLAGVFREAVWYPSTSAAREGAPAWRSRKEHAHATPRQDRWEGNLPPRRHLGTIYYDEFESLVDLRADLLLTHEAPGYHPHGFHLLDDLARSMGVKALAHGHHHDAHDSSVAWGEQGFASVGVGLRGITAIDIDSEGKVRLSVVRKGELDDQRTQR